MLRFLSLIVVSFIALLPAKADVFCFNPVPYNFNSDDNPKYGDKEKACLEAASKFATRKGSILRIYFNKELRHYYLVNNPFACQKGDDGFCIMSYLVAFYPKIGLLVTEVTGTTSKSFELYDPRTGDMHPLDGFPYLSSDEKTLFVGTECERTGVNAFDYQILSIEKDDIKVVAEKKATDVCHEFEKFESPTKIKISYFKFDAKTNTKSDKKFAFINKTPKGWALEK